MDRRVKRTKRALRDALLGLMQEKGYELITVEEITDRANLGRTTFYLHYRDKEDLLLERFSEVLEHLVEQLAEMPLNTWLIASSDDFHPSQIKPGILLFEHAAENANLYRIVLKGEGAQTTAKRLRELILDALNKVVAVKTQEALNMTLEIKVPIPVFSHYFAGSLLGLLTWWLEEDMPYTPEQMARMFQQLFLPSTQSVLKYREEIP